MRFVHGCRTMAPQAQRRYVKVKLKPGDIHAVAMIDVAEIC
jgi:hypothetical protein